MSNRTLHVGMMSGAFGLLALSGCFSKASSGNTLDDDAGGSSGSAASGSASSGDTSSGSSSTGSGSTGSGSGSTPGGGSGSGTSSGSGSSSGSASGGTPMLLAPDPNGYIGPSTNSVAIQGAWYAYGDSWGTDGAPPGNCESKGMHAESACSSITAPPPAMIVDGGSVATFPQTTAGTMCLSGTAAKVVASDYSNMFGIGIGLDFNNVGGVKMPYSATENHVVGFSFHIAGVPTGASVRVELPIPATDPSGDSWSRTISSDGDYTMDLSTATGDANGLKPSFAMTGTQPAFDATQIESIQFHIPTTTAAAVTVAMLCVSNFAVIVGP
ncbi:MAG TPA: hypothetical protein VH044_20005 [Polyangiaceae bacterium]|nr:hypothetical protein [Polyangiaceae bacterium]